MSAASRRLLTGRLIYDAALISRYDMVLPLPHCHTTIAAARLNNASRTSRGAARLATIAEALLR